LSPVSKQTEAVEFCQDDGHRLAADLYGDPATATGAPPKAGDAR
jgi:hypothetical protein